MKKTLKIICSALFHAVKGMRYTGPNGHMQDAHPGLYGDCSHLKGNCSGLWGDCTGLRGDATNVWGNCTHIYGNFDDCEITEPIYITELLR